jgi:2-polyprenyl-3-methyl-5-hydroxy-6-metoxy-1,4-benzoquinol methylase
VPENQFGEEVAARYDDTIGEYGEPTAIEAAVDFLAELAGEGAALELGIGTGRIALPLAARGVPVHGIDLSEAMVGSAQSRAASRSPSRSAISRRRVSTGRSPSLTSSSTRS